MNRTRLVGTGIVALASLVAMPTLARAADYHHVHVTASNATEAVRWYTRYMGCQALADRDDGVDCGGAQVVFDSRPTLGSSQRTGIDHIAFSYADLTAKMAELERVGVQGSGVRLQRFEDGSTLRDLPGPVWTGDAAHGIAFERPRDVSDTDVLTPEQAAARRERGTLGSIWGYEAEWRDTTLGYVNSAPSRQIAMVVDPPDGRIPPRNQEAQERTAAARGTRRRGLAEGPENLSNWVRCITRGLVPMPTIYNNGLQIVQGPGFVTVQREMVHETRVIPTDDRPHLGSTLTSYLGDPRGHWDGDTLVVEITNFNGRSPFRGSSENLTLTERYTRTGPDTLRYEFTLDDPTVWTRP